MIVIVRMVMIMRVRMFMVMIMIVRMFAMMMVVVVIVTVRLTRCMRMRHAGVMGLTRTMRMITRIVEMTFFHVLVQVFMLVRMGVKVNVYVAIRTMDMTVCVQEISDDMPVVLVHLLFMQDPVEKFMGHQCQWQLELVALQKPAIVQDRCRRPVGLDAAIDEQQATIADLQGDIQVMGT